MDQTFGLIKNALNAAELRQEMISSNIANVNTDGYKVNKVEFESLLDSASNGFALTKTDDQHFGIADLTDVQPIVSKRTNTSIKDNGNNVDIEVEMMDQSENSLYYNALVAQLNTKYSMLNSVITK
ncbi:MAG: flagellar basal body rod protein FlgB [Desemzia incerta]|uniref:flagellar basal body rod protein FlgB n=1 Tax=Desemzia incerta TaxID=82801 RepID=UPI0033154AA8